MRRDDIMVEVRDRTLARLGTIDSRFLQFKATLRANDVDEWTLSLPGSHPMVPHLATPGSGIIVHQRTAAGWRVAMSGPTTKPNRKRNRENVDGLHTYSGVSDDIVLADALAYGDPANAADAQTVANDTRTGTAQAIMHAYVNANIGPGALPARRTGLNAYVTVAAASGLGGAATKSPRFQTLLSLCQELGVLGALRFKVVQEGGALVFRSDSAQDRTALVRLDVQNGTLESEESELTPPGVTRPVVAGQGEGAARVIVLRSTADAVAAEAEWGRRIEVFKDARDKATTVELEQAGDELLEASGRTVRAVRASASDDQSMRYGTDWVEGDLVTVVANGQEYVAPVTSAVISMGPDAVLVGAAIGNVSTMDESAALKAQVEQNTTRIGVLERNAEIAQQGQAVPTGAIMAFAGATAPSGWLLCDGAAVSRTDYADLFATIGTTYGAGDGSTTFNLPNRKGRVGVGRDAAQTEFDTLGETGGAKTHTLTAAEMPSHTHVQNAHAHGLTDPGHNHTQNAHTHVQNSHNHTQDAHTHTQAAHSHTLTDPGHNHTQNSHTHTQNAHSHATTTDTSAKAVSTTTTSASADYNNSGSGYIRNALLSDNVTGSTTAVNQSTTATNNASTTGITLGSATPTINSATATNQAATATNQNTTATNNAATTGATVNNATAVNQNTGGDGAHNNLQPYLVTNYIIKA